MAYVDDDSEVQRVRYEVRRFRQHFITYLAVIGVLFLINAMTGGFWFGHWWFFWIALIWGVILALEAAHLFGEDIGRDWEDRMVDQVVARRRRRTTGAPPPVYTPPQPPRPPPQTACSPPPGTPDVRPTAAPDAPSSSPHVPQVI
jgi:hypothetical protein